MATTIQISEKLKRKLVRHKEYARQTYEEVIEKALALVEEEDLEPSEGTKRQIAAARKRIKAGKSLTTEEVRRELGF
ncbi:MAG: hypothetical protein ACYDDF_09765 [Thermoplasmatota archaeon]